MSIAFKCTSCGRGLRANPEMVGKKTKCPGCSTVLTIPGAEAPAGASKPAGAKTSPAAPAGAVLTCEGCGTKVRSKPEWAGKAIKCPNCQGRIKVPGAAPAVASPITPAARKPVPQPADDEPLPDDDDAGMGDDDVDDRPARKKAAPPPKKKSSAGLLIALLLLVVAGGGGFFAWAFYFNEPDHLPAPILRKDAGKDDDDDEKKGPKSPTLSAAGNPFDSVPTDAVAFVNIKPQALLKSSLGKKILADLEGNSDFGKAQKQITDAFGVNLSDVVDAVLVMRDVPISQADPLASSLFIVSMEISIDPKGFAADFDGKKFEKKDRNGIPYYTMGPGKEKTALLQTATNVVVGGDEKAVVRFIDGGSPKIGPLSPLLKSASVGKHLAFVGFQVPGELAERAKKEAPPFAKGFMSLAEAKTGQLEASEEKGIKVLAKLNFEDAGKVEESKKALDGLLGIANAMLPEASKAVPPMFANFVKIGEDAFKSIKPAVVENTLEIPIQINLSLDQLGDLIGPVIMQMRGAAQGAATTNNLRQIGLAMHNFHDTYRHLPEAKLGAGLSWRVALLPFLEQSELFKQFKLDEPWDSDHNKQFLERMPALFEHPTRKAPPGYTYFRVFVGPNTLFEEGKKTTLPRITDGTSNTLMIVEAADPVPWSKADELLFDPTGPLPKLGDPAKGGAFLLIRADASMDFIQVLDEATLRALITPNGGEKIDDTKIRRLRP